MSPIIREQIVLASHTTLAVGGPARFWVEARDVGEIRQAMDFAARRGLDLYVLGSGSNVVIADRGLDAVVLRPRLPTVETRVEGDELRIRAGAGVSWNDVVRLAVEHDAGGIECLAGIPGEVGAAPLQNIGAYGQEVADAITTVVAVDRMSQREVTLTRQECAFGYRDSLFKSAARHRYVIAEVELCLRRGAEPRIVYPELRDAVAARRAPPTLASVREAVVELRRRKSMVLDSQDENRRSVGSFFVNPTLSAGAFAELEQRAAAQLGAAIEVPHHPTAQGRVKVPAAWLIERSGMAKGCGHGRVGLSSRHTLAIVNRGGASAAEVVAFAAEVRARVHDGFGVSLQPEPQLLGFEPDELASLLD